MTSRLWPLMLVSAACLLGGHAEAVPAEPVAMKPVLGRPAKNQGMVFLTVDKSNLRADLRSWSNQGERSDLLMSFRIAIGKAEGDKQAQGDNRTPEGIYFAEKVLDGSGLPSKYGPKAIPINFPNPIDRLSGKTGYGIWLHGVEADKRVDEAKVTEGCVAFYNADIVTLTDWLKPKQAIVIIANKAESVNRPQDVAEVRQLTKQWSEAWGERNLSTYIGMYADDFHFENMDKDAFASYKERVFHSYNTMSVKISELQVFSHEKYAVAVMNQDFRGDRRFSAVGRKVLYWQRQKDGHWAIAHELFDNRRLEMTAYDTGEVAQLFKNSPSAKLFESQAPGERSL